MPRLIVALAVLCVAFGYRFVSPVRKSSLSMAASTETSEEEVLSPFKQRRLIQKQPLYNRMGFKDQKKKIAEEMKTGYSSSLVAEMRENGGSITRGDVTIKLAEYYGFCWGVERAIAIAYEARAQFPDKTIHITNEIIHNPEVNENLADLNIKFLPGELGNKNYDNVEEGDVVILPAFGAQLEEMSLLTDRKVQIVDTTCPWVSKVWSAVDSHQKKGLTSIIHGKWAHEETIATASFCLDYIIVKDKPEAEYVADYIVNGGDRTEFLEKFKDAMSEGFDPDKHLKKVGLANQTTMYKRETKQIGRIFEVAMLKAFGPEKLGENYVEFDTICDATQERQDAVTEIVDDHDKGDEVDFILVVGGFDSSNTAHLKEIPEHANVRNYHIDRAERITAENTIEHRLTNGDIVVEEGFMKKGKVTVGVTSGASTPDKSIEDALERILMLSKLLDQ